MISTEFQESLDLAEGNLRLLVKAHDPADPEKGWVPAYRLLIIVDGTPVGTIDLRLGETDVMVRYGGQVGYAIDPPHRGHRYAARALRLVTSLARHHGFDVLWISCNPENLPSRRTCELAGAELVEIVDLPPDCDMYANGDRKKCRYRIVLSPITRREST
jgi:predicted acetyltransferase